jgi:hypothetical protein
MVKHHLIIRADDAACPIHQDSAVVHVLLALLFRDNDGAKSSGGKISSRLFSNTSRDARFTPNMLRPYNDIERLSLDKLWDISMFTEKKLVECFSLAPRFVCTTPTASDPAEVRSCHSADSNRTVHQHHHDNNRKVSCWPPRM